MIRLDDPQSVLLLTLHTNHVLEKEGVSFEEVHGMNRVQLRYQFAILIAQRFIKKHSLFIWSDFSNFLREVGAFTLDQISTHQGAYGFVVRTPEISLAQFKALTLALHPRFEQGLLAPNPLDWRYEWFGTHGPQSLQSEIDELREQEAADTGDGAPSSDGVSRNALTLADDEAVLQMLLEQQNRSMGRQAGQGSLFS